MGPITSLGVGSGLDLNTIVTQLVALERRPLQQMQQQANQLSGQVSLYGRVQSLFGGLQDAANKLTDPALWKRSAVTVADTSVLGATAGSSAAAGSYRVEVQSLAESQTLAAGVASTDANALVGAGTLTLQLGQWGGSFEPKVGSAPIDISLDGSDTLATLRDKINAAGAGVSASLVTDATGVRLALRSSEGGAVNGFRLQVNDPDGDVTDGAGLSRFAYDPGAGVAGLQLRQPGADAVAVINGITVRSATNQITGAVDGLTLDLRKPGSTTTVTLASDRETITKTVRDFVDAYNALAGFLGEQTRFDPGSKTGGPLQGDAAATGLQSRLRSLLGSTSSASSAFARLSDIGLEAQRDGTLRVNAGKLDRAAANLPELEKAMSAAAGGNTAAEGFARRYATLARQALATDGTVTTRTEGLRKLITDNTEQQSRLNERVERFQRRLVEQYTAMDGNVARLRSVASYVEQQMAALARANGSGNR